jgi:hypothetical protein
MAGIQGYNFYQPRAPKATCGHCGSKMGVASGDPSDKKKVCHSARCNREQMIAAGILGANGY